jgi:hypothetical protein
MPLTMTWMFSQSKIPWQSVDIATILARLASDWTPFGRSSMLVGLAEVFAAKKSID